MIYERFGVFYAVHYISQLLKSLGFSYPKARFVSGHFDPAAREKWLAEQCPAILATAKRKNADLLSGKRLRRKAPICTISRLSTTSRTR
jgi:hypothetical protein